MNRVFNLLLEEACVSLPSSNLLLGSSRWLYTVWKRIVEPTRSPEIGSWPDMSFFTSYTRVGKSVWVEFSDRNIGDDKGSISNTDSRHLTTLSLVFVDSARRGLLCDRVSMKHMCSGTTVRFERHVSMGGAQCCDDDSNLSLYWFTLVFSDRLSSNADVFE